MKTKKKIVNTISEFRMLKSIMKKEAFYNRFELSMKLVAEVAAEDGMVNNAFTDTEMTSAQKKLLIKGKF